VQAGEQTSGAYVCGQSVELTQELIRKYALLDKISTIIPGANTKATFYSEANLSGLEYTFWNTYYQPLTHFHFHGSKIGNDSPQSVYVSSTIDTPLPEVSI